MKELIGKEILGREWKVWKHVPSGVWECDWECRYKQGNIPPETGEKYHSVQKYLSFKRESLDKINTLTWKVISDRCTNLRLRIFPCLPNCTTLVSASGIFYKIPFMLTMALGLVLFPKKFKRWWCNWNMGAFAREVLAFQWAVTEFSTLQGLVRWSKFKIILVMRNWDPRSWCSFLKIRWWYFTKLDDDIAGT